MSDEIDWSKPIAAEMVVRSVVGTPSRSAGYDLSSVRREQIQRAQLLVAATGGKPLTAGKGPAHAAAIVSALAKAIPGLRYKRGPLVYFGLAPHSSVAPVEGLPGKPLGAPQKWTAANLASLLQEFEALRRETLISAPEAHEALAPRYNLTPVRISRLLTEARRGLPTVD